MFGGFFGATFVSQDFLFCEFSNVRQLYKKRETEPLKFQMLDLQIWRIEQFSWNRPSLLAYFHFFTTKLKWKVCIAHLILCWNIEYINRDRYIFIINFKYTIYDIRTKLTKNFEKNCSNLNKIPREALCFFQVQKKSIPDFPYFSREQILLILDYWNFRKICAIIHRYIFIIYFKHA